MDEIINLSVIEELKEIGDIEFLQELIDLFVPQGEGLVADIKASYESNDLVNLGKHVHKLKGSCLNIGATAMGKLCQDIEASIKENSSELQQQVNHMENVFNSTKQELNRIISG